MSLLSFQICALGMVDGDATTVLHSYNIKSGMFQNYFPQIPRSKSTTNMAKDTVEWKPKIERYGTSLQMIHQSNVGNFSSFLSFCAKAFSPSLLLLQISDISLQSRKFATTVSLV